MMLNFTDSYKLLHVSQKHNNQQFFLTFIYYFSVEQQQQKMQFCLIHGAGGVLILAFTVRQTSLLLKSFV